MIWQRQCQFNEQQEQVKEEGKKPLHDVASIITPLATLPPPNHHNLHRQHHPPRLCTSCRSWQKRCKVCGGILFVLLNLLYGIWLVPQPTSQIMDSAEPWELPKATKLFGVLFFKEESHALVEVLLNLYSQGVDHVILVDNMSQHALPMDVLEFFSKHNFVTLRKDVHAFAQKRAYRQASQYARWKGADWIMNVDADEFPYATQLGSIHNYLALQSQEVCSIASTFRMFGSDEREEQPNSIVHGFVGRTNHTIRSEPVGGYKTFARMKCTMWLAVHRAALIPRYSLRAYTATPGFPRNGAPALDVRTEQERPPDLVTNHYRIQSHRFFMDIKSTRGNPNNNGRVRNESSFRRGAFNHTIDTTLLHKVKSRFPSLYTPDLAFQPNSDYLSPWPLKNVQQAWQELQRHQVLVIMDAQDTRPDTLGNVLRNAAILDPTLDCLVRVSPGQLDHLTQITKLCKVVEGFPETQSWEHFIQHTWNQLLYHQHYQGLVVLQPGTLLEYGMETAFLRRRAIQLSAMQMDKDDTKPFYYLWPPQDKDSKSSLG